ncbi:hypothetical protein J4460_03895 [Candidatus Woesearchaeota archaeon]|nr:hypothetical protein [Candidatus Woesearchaeota archaeon]HIH38274.1 hypothetical protein [Candidatus Woesearchaeota archaeon]HIH49152.1 hypothetical protein [Candidatus Woesearchaeota archaeon]HIJ04430.1 hypothetical protein [Candidatus Woesearchaeota archaeon]
MRWRQDEHRELFYFYFIIQAITIMAIVIAKFITVSSLLATILAQTAEPLSGVFRTK